MNVDGLSPKELIDMARERTNLSNYTNWERGFVKNQIRLIEEGKELSQRQVSNLRQIAEERW